MFVPYLISHKIYATGALGLLKTSARGGRVIGHTHPATANNNNLLATYR